MAFQLVILLLPSQQDGQTGPIKTQRTCLPLCGSPDNSARVQVRFRSPLGPAPTLSLASPSPRLVTEPLFPCAAGPLLQPRVCALTSPELGGLLPRNAQQLPHSPPAGLDSEAPFLMPTFLKLELPPPAQSSPYPFPALLSPGHVLSDILPPLVYCLSLPLCVNSMGVGTGCPYVTDEPSNVGAGSMLKERNESISLFNFHNSLPNSVFPSSVFICITNRYFSFFLHKLFQTNYTIVQFPFCSPKTMFWQSFHVSIYRPTTDDRVFENKIPRWCRIINGVIREFFIWLNLMFPKFRQLTMADQAFGHYPNETPSISVGARCGPAKLLNLILITDFILCI